MVAWGLQDIPWDAIHEDSCRACLHEKEEPWVRHPLPPVASHLCAHGHGDAAQTHGVTAAWVLTSSRGVWWRGLFLLDHGKQFRAPTTNPICLNSRRLVNLKATVAYCKTPGYRQCLTVPWAPVSESRVRRRRADSASSLSSSCPTSRFCKAMTLLSLTGTVSFSCSPDKCSGYLRQIYKSHVGFYSPHLCCRS